MRAYENRVLGGIIAGFVAPSEIDLSPSDFTDTDIGDCVLHAQKLESEGIKVDPDILHSRLKAGSDCFYSPQDFKLMAVSVGSSSVVWEAIDQVKSAAMKTLILSEAAEIALQKDKSSSFLLDRVRALVDKAESDYRVSSNNFVFLNDIVPQLKTLYDDLHSGVSYSVPTSFPEIDHLLLDGFSRGDEHVIVGFTGSGKSALALAFARAQAKTGMVVGVVSREMSAIENSQRLLASDSGIPRWQMRKGMADHTHRDLNAHLDGTFASLPIAFDTRTSRVEDLRPQVKRMVEGFDMKILYVDYLQLLGSKNNSSNRATEVQAISRTLKEIAMDNKIPVVSLCQFNRGASQASIYDILSHLKESSGIEQDASTILYIQIEKTEERKQVKDAKLTVLKNRNGATFQSINLSYRGETFTFYEQGDEYGGQAKPLSF